MKEIIKDIITEFHKDDLPYIMPRLKALNVTVTTQHFVEAIHDRDIEIHDIWGGAPITRPNVSTVVMAMTRTANDQLFVSSRDHCATCVRIGDVVAPRKLEAVIHDAERQARQV